MATLLRQPTQRVREIGDASPHPKGPLSLGLIQFVAGRDLFRLQTSLVACAARPHRLLSCVGFALSLALAIDYVSLSAPAMDIVRFEEEGRAQSVAGRILVEATDGGLLVESRDGVLWAIEPQQIVSREPSGEAFTPLTREQLAAGLLDDLPAGFQVHTAAHYVLFYDTSKDYALWCGGLFERLYRAFTNFWSRRGLELRESEYPLPVIIFADADDYANFARDELGEAASSIVAYYSLRTNRVVMHDLSGVEALRSQQGVRRRSLSINALLSQPAAEPLVATIVHEATHQIAFNCGLHTRYSDVPLWLSEGLAIYFETPDLSSSQGWQGIGRVNYRRLATYRETLARREPLRLEQLISNDRLFRDTRTGPGAYADAWVLTYYLLRTRQEDYVAYLKTLAEKPQLIWDDESARIADFQKYFGEDLAKLDAQVREYTSRIR
jgi:hypothetical protein